MPTLEDRAHALETATNAALDELILLGTSEQSAAARKLRDARTLAALRAAIISFEAGTQTFVDLTAGLRDIIEAISVNPIGDALAKFNGLLAEAEELLAEIHDSEGLASAAENEAEAAEPVTDLPSAPSGPVPVAPPADTSPAASPAPPPAPPPAAVTTPAALTVSTSTGFAALMDEYQSFFDGCVVRADKAESVKSQSRRLIEFRSRYEAVGDPLGIPWFFIGAIHGLESSYNFTTHLHNGDPLRARTVRVPPGRPESGAPPFTWEESATDAMKLKGFDRQSDWSVPAMLYRWERYNGLGYRRKGLPSPYLWSFSNRYEKGKYVRDGVFDPEAVSKQCGAATLLRQMLNAGDLALS